MNTISGYPPGGAGVVGREMSTSSVTKPSASAPGTLVASAAFAGRPSKPSYFAGTRTPLTPPMFGVRPNVGVLPSLQNSNVYPGAAVRAWQSAFRAAGISACATAAHASMPSENPCCCEPTPHSCRP